MGHLHTPLSAQEMRFLTRKNILFSENSVLYDLLFFTIQQKNIS